MKKLFRQLFELIIGGTLALCGPVAAFGQWGQFDNGYIVSPDCKPLKGVTVTVKFTQTVITDGVGGDFGFQLSAWSLDHRTKGSTTWEAPYVVWQQYMTGVGVNPPFVNPTMQAWGPLGSSWHLVEAWPWNGTQGQLLPLSVLKQSSPNGLETLTIPAGYAIAAGTEFTIALQNDGDGNVTGAAFRVADVPNSASGHPGSAPSPVLWKHGPNFKEEYLAPIVGFEFNFIGGTGNVLSVLPWVSGEVGTQVPVGTITYTASGPMSVLTNPGVWPTPPSCSASNSFTGEITNAFYTPLEPVQGASNTLTQSFGIVVQPAKAPSPAAPVCKVTTQCATTDSDSYGEVSCAGTDVGIGVIGQPPTGHNGATTATASLKLPAKIQACTYSAAFSTCIKLAANVPSGCSIPPAPSTINRCFSGAGEGEIWCQKLNRCVPPSQFGDLCGLSRAGLPRP
jgi:hypothetical protein